MPPPLQLARVHAEAGRHAVPREAAGCLEPVQTRREVLRQQRRAEEQLGRHRLLFPIAALQDEQLIEPHLQDILQTLAGGRRGIALPVE